MENCKHFYNGKCYGQKGSPGVECLGDVTECEKYTPIEYEENMLTIFKKNLIIRLKEYTYDYIKVYIANDNLIIEFYYKHELSYNHIEYSIESKVMSGLTTEMLAQKVIRSYGKVLHFRHFKSIIC